MRPLKKFVELSVFWSFFRPSMDKPVLVYWDPMKICSTCGHSNDDDSGFCVIDGTVLGRSGRVVVTMEESESETSTQVFQKPMTGERPRPARSERPALLYGLMGGLIATVLFLLGYILLAERRPDDANSQVRVSPSPGVAENSSSPYPSGTLTPSSPSPATPTSANASDSNSPEPTIKKAEEMDVDDTPRPEGRKKEAPAGRGVNGRVIAWNAVIRTGPSMDAYAIGTISFNQPVKIGKPSGPWYRVTVPGGVNGWMHGNTIEFVR